MSCSVSIECSSYPIRHILSVLRLPVHEGLPAGTKGEPFVSDICLADPKKVTQSTHVFVNGDLLGVIYDVKNTALLE